LLEVADDLAVIANTGDDVEIYGVHVAPDPDLVTYWLADEIDERGYGIRGDTWEVMAALERAGQPTWFRLGDRDLAMCLIRTQLLREGRTLTDAHAAVVAAMDVEARVLPMCDEPVETFVKARGSWRPFQQFMIVERAAGPVEAVELRGVERARPTAEVLAVLAEAEVIVIGPSNPVISIGPILALPGMREAVAGSPAPVVAVSPFVGGHAIKGPTDEFCRHVGIELSASGVAAVYDGLIDGLVADEKAEGIATLVLDTLMESQDDRARVAGRTLEFAGSFSG
jgi:LPPG:FO 2-phospho-L-lactate transferase